MPSVAKDIIILSSLLILRLSEYAICNDSFEISNELGEGEGGAAIKRDSVLFFPTAHSLYESHQHGYRW